MTRLGSLLCTTLLYLICSCVANKHNNNDDKSRSSSSPKKTSADYWVDKDALASIEPAFGQFEGDIYSGTIATTSVSNDNDNDNDEDGSLMFYYWDPAAPSVNDTIVFWFNGGPGCSSVAGMLFENSPVAVPLRESGYKGPSSAQDPLVWNEYGWTRATRMVYVEQPHGVGFSVGPEPVNEEQVATYFYHFLQRFMNVFPEARKLRLVLFGESYAGYYVPSMAKKIVEMNREHQQQKEDKSSQIRLHGIALGNGWVDAAVQGPMLVQYAWWHGLIDTTTRKALEQKWEQCQRDPSSMQPPFHAFTTPDDCGMVGAVVQAAGGGILTENYGYGQFDFPNVNIYDVTTWDGYAVLFDEKSTYSKFFNNPQVRELLHAPDMVWEQCIPGAGRRRHRRRLNLLDHDTPVTVMPYIGDLLDQNGIQVLIYNGDRDMSTCSQGNEVLLDEMEWRGKNEWSTTPRGMWVVDEYPAGYSKPLHNLNFVVVYNSGHLVPYNQPKVALDLIERFLLGTSFVDHELPNFVDKESKSYLSEQTQSHHFLPLVGPLLIGILLGVLGTFAVMFIVNSGKLRDGYQPIHSQGRS